MNNKTQSPIVGYGIAVAFTMLATGLYLLVQAYLGTDVPYITFFPAVFATAFFTRFGPTLLAVALSALAAASWFVPPEDALVPTQSSDWAGLGLFSLFGIACALLGERMHRKSGQILRERERFSVTLSSIGDGVIVTDENAHVTFLNSVAERLTGWSIEQAQGKPVKTVFRIIDERSRQPAEGPVGEVLREGRVIGPANHTILISKDDCERVIDHSAAAVRERDGRVSGVVLVFRDLSQRRASQIAQGRLAALVDSSEDAILGQTFQGVVTDWNAGAERLFGFSAEETIGRPIFSTIVPAERKDELLEVLQRVRHGDRVEQFETVRQCKDGRKIPVAVRISPIHDAEGKVIGASAIDRDISQQRLAEQRRNARLAVTQILAHEKSIEKAISEILAAVGVALRWDVGCFWRVHPDEQVLRCSEFWQDPSRDVQEFRTATAGLAFGRGKSLPGRVWESGQPIWVPDVTVDPQFIRATRADDVGLHGGFACPIAVGDQFLGAVEWFSHEIQQPDEDLLEMMVTIGGQIGQFIERRQAEHDLQRSEQELSDFFENAAVGLHWVGPGGRVQRVNQAELDMLGYSRDEYLGHHIAEFHADRPVIDEILETLTAGEQLHDREARLRCKDGAIKHVLIDSNVLWEDGQFIHTRCFTRDITERKRIERSLRFLAEASKSLSALVDYRSTLQKVAHLAVPNFADWCTVDMLDADGELQRLAAAHVDPAKARLAEELHHRFPSAPDALRGVRSVLRTGEPELVSQIDDGMLEAAAQDDEHLRILRELELKSYICVPLKTIGTTLGAITFVSAESGRRYGSNDLTMAEDLAHRAAIAIENARLYGQVREADRRKDEFLAMLAHELRNPLAPIRSGLDILAMDSGSHPETIKLMQEQVEHVVRLVDDLLDVSRIMRNRVELRREQIEVSALVKRSVEAVRPMIDSHEQELIVSLPQQPIWLDADPVRLVQVIENLLNNASKYTDAGGRIEVSAQLQEGEAVLSVRDTGIGIEPELLPNVFKLFTQSSRSLDRAQGGLGIGLTLVQRLVDMHGGTVSVDSPGPDRGSTFTVRLPVTESAAPVRKNMEPSRASPSHRILVVDDNVGAAKMLTTLLTKLNDHQVETAHDGPSALAKINETQPEIVLLDIGLPGMDGYQVAREVRQHHGLDGVLLIALTGYGQQEDRQKSKEAGFDEHLVKPPSIDQIKQILVHPKLAP